MCALVITATTDALPLALCLPSLYSILADRFSKPSYAMLVGLAPALLMVVPGYTHSGIMFVCLIACGIILNKCIHRGNFGLSVLLPSCLIFSLFVIGIFYEAGQKNIAPQAMIGQWVNGVMDQVSSLYAQTLSRDSFSEFSLNRPAIQSRIVEVFWGITASSVLSVMWMNLLIAKGPHRHMQLRTWKCPDWIVGFFILAGALILIQYDLAHTIGLNLLIVTAQIYFFQGLAIIAFAMFERHWSKFIRWVIYILILTQIYIMIGVAALGLFDTWFNFRNKIRNTKGEET